MTLLALEEIAGIRGGRLLFERVSLSLAPGDATVVTGPNGIGKSSLLRIAAGLLRPAAGRVTGAARRALLAEAAALDADRTVAAALRFWAALDGVPEAARRVAAALDRLALEPLATVPVRMLSTGQRRRVAFARVLAGDAPVWLLDEPANGLDAAAVARLEAAIAGHRAAGGAVLAATHLPLDLPGGSAIDLSGLAP